MVVSKVNAPNSAGRPLDDIRQLLNALPGPNTEAVTAVQRREAQLVKPPGSLGRLEGITEWMAAWQGGPAPTVERPRVAIFASSHGVAARGVSAYPPSVTRQMLDTFTAGRAAINQICTTFDIGLKVFDLAVDIPTPDIAAAPAMDERTCAATMGFGMEAVAEELDLLCLGDMGIGNTTVAAAIYHALWGGSARDWAGPGTGLDAEAVARKADVIAQAVAFHKPHLADPFEVLRRLGGREVAAIAGAIVAARIQRVPVLLDGFVVTAAAAILKALEPRALEHCRAAHCSAEPAHRPALEKLGLVPFFDLGMRLGEGTGAALAVALVRAALACHHGMATFAEAKVDSAAGRG